MSGKRRLPAPDEPLYDGENAIVPTAPAMFRRVQMPSQNEAVRLVSSTRRKLADMPALPPQMNSFAAILVYTASGLTDAEISVATGFAIEQIQRMREQDAYRTLEQMVLKTAREEAAGVVKGILVKAEEDAARRMTALVESQDEKIALAASKDVLDRGGYKPREQIDINQTMMSTFRIELVDRRNEKVIDMVSEEQE